MKTQNSILSQVKDGDIVLMHALYLSTAQACKTVIPELHARGYQLVTVSELIHFRGQNVQGGNGVQYKNFPPIETAAAESSTASSVSETVKETSVQSSLQSVKESSKSSETTKETKSTKTASKSTESKSNTEATKESGNIVENPGIATESKTAEKSTKESAGNIAGAIDAEDPQ